MPDLHEELRRLSEYAGEPRSIQDLARARRSRSRRRRAGGLVVGLLVFLAAGVFLLTAFRDHGGPVPADTVPTGWTTHTNPYGWTIEVPEGWSVTPLGPSDQGTRFEGSAMSLEIKIEPPPAASLPPSVALPAGLTLPPTDDSKFPLDADQLLSNTGTELGGQFVGDGQRFDVLVLLPSLPGPLPRNDADILDRMIGSISFQPWKIGEIRHGWEAIPTPAQDVSWVTLRGGTYMLFRTTEGYRIYGAITCAGEPPSSTSATPDGFAVLGCPDGSAWQMDAEGASGGGCIASANDPPPEWVVVTAHDGTLIALVIPGYFPSGTGGSGYGYRSCGVSPPSR
jgi:hypothetical protein